MIKVVVMIRVIKSIVPITIIPIIIPIVRIVIIIEWSPVIVIPTILYTPIIWICIKPIIIIVN
jgi:hypothetical protein